ncbi:DUF418 domain-containing protein [Corynebacteriaceae bacterium 6-324]
MAVDDNRPAQQPLAGTTTKARMVVPDVARGMALLGIAIANIPTAWLTPGAPHTAFLGSINNSFDQILAVLTTMFAHNRGLPLFSTLLGFGVGLIAMSLWRKQFPAKRARQIIVRRYFFLALFGAIHLIFIFYGDIMFYYGLTGIILGLLLTVRDKILSIIAYVVLAVLTAAGTLFLVWALMSGLDMSGVTESVNIGDFDTTTLGGLLAFNATTFAINFVSYPFYLVGYAPIMLIGFTWARRGVLADVPAHRKELWTWVVIGWLYILGVGLPWGLSEIGVLPNGYAETFMFANMMNGAITGPALLAMFALALQPFQERVNRGETPPVWLQVPMALGKRSMSGYLFQSFAFFIICYPFVLGITPDSVSAQIGLAIGVWGVSLILAWMLEKANMQGPFEKVHRRLSYGPTLQPELYSAKQRKKLEQGQD